MEVFQFPQTFFNLSVRVENASAVSFVLNALNAVLKWLPIIRNSVRHKSPKHCIQLCFSVCACSQECLLLLSPPLNYLTRLALSCIVVPSVLVCICLYLLKYPHLASEPCVSTASLCWLAQQSLLGHLYHIFISDPKSLGKIRLLHDNTGANLFL